MKKKAPAKTNKIYDILYQNLQSRMQNVLYVDMAHQLGVISAYNQPPYSRDIEFFSTFSALYLLDKFGVEMDTDVDVFNDVKKDLKNALDAVSKLQNSISRSYQTRSLVEGIMNDIKKPNIKLPEA